MPQDLVFKIAWIWTLIACCIFSQEIPEYYSVIFNSLVTVPELLHFRTAAMHQPPLVVSCEKKLRMDSR